MGWLRIYLKKVNSRTLLLSLSFSSCLCRAFKLMKVSFGIPSRLELPNVILRNSFLRFERPHFIFNSQIGTEETHREKVSVFMDM